MLGAARRVVAIGLHRELVGREIDFFEVSYCLFPVGALMVAALWIYLVIMNLAAIAISLPAALVMAPYLGVAPDVVLYVSLTAAGIPFLLLVGAAPNAIAYRSKPFSVSEFFIAAVPASLLLLAVIALFPVWIWGWMGMPILL